MKWIIIAKILYIIFFVNTVICNNTLLLDIFSSEKVGIENSPQIKLISHQQQIKKLLVQENWRNYFPTATIRWDRNTNVIRNSDDSRSQRVTLNVEQVVYDGGRRSLALKTALNDLDLAKYDLRLALNDLRYKIRSSFYNLLSKKAQMVVIKKSIERQSEQVFFAESEKKLGESTVIQLLEIKNRLNEIKLQEKNVKIAYSTQIEDFKILLRIGSDNNIDLKGDILNSVVYKYEELPEEDLIGIASKLRIEFDKTKAAEIQAVSQNEYAKTFYIPTISLGGYYGYRGEEYPPRQPEMGFNFRMSMMLGPNTFSDSSNIVSRNDDTDRTYSSSTSFAIMDQLQYKRQIVSTGIAAYQAKLSRMQVADIIKNEVKKVHSNYKISWDAMKQADENMEIFEKRILIKQEQVRLGEARRTDLAETEIRYLEAKNAQIAARVRYMLSIAELEIATGLSLDDLKLIQIL